MHIAYNVQLNFAYVNYINFNVLLSHPVFTNKIPQNIIFPLRLILDTVDDWNVYPALTR
jgi:hypothetical protein